MVKALKIKCIRGNWMLYEPHINLNSMALLWEVLGQGSKELNIDITSNINKNTGFTFKLIRYDQQNEWSLTYSCHNEDNAFIIDIPFILLNELFETPPVNFFIL